MVHRDKDDPSSPQLQGWMLLMTDDRVLLTLKPPLLIIPADGLPENAQFTIRAAPGTQAPEASRPILMGFYFCVLRVSHSCSQDVVPKHFA